jgi:hypothetical protein
LDDFKRVAFLVSLALLLAAGNASALPLEDFQPHPSSDEFYSEQWSVSVWAENKCYVHVQFVVSNLGMGDKKGAFKVEVTAPDEVRYSGKSKVGSDWSAESDRFRIIFGKARFEQKGKEFDLQADTESMSVTLHIKSLMEGWNPGNGKPIYEDANGRYGFAYLTPRASFSGELKMNGKTIPISGIGLIDHSWTTIAPHKLAKRWAKIKFFSGDTTLLFTGFASPNTTEPLDKGWIFLAKGNERLLATSIYRVKFGDMMTDVKTKSRYAVPRLIEISAEQSGRLATIVLKTKKLLRRKNILDDLSELERFVVSRISEPVDYTFNGDVHIAISEAQPSNDMTMDRNSDYVFQYINP